MGELPQKDGAPSVADSIRKRRGKAAGGPMNIEELRMNKGLLKEVSKMKRQYNTSVDHEGAGSSHLGMQHILSDSKLAEIEDKNVLRDQIISAQSNTRAAN